MPESQRINITLPKKLVQKSRVLIEEGLYSNFSELIREGIKDEIELSKPQIDKVKLLNIWFREEEHKGFDTSHLSREDIIARLRKTRDQIWKQRYESR